MFEIVFSCPACIKQCVFGALIDYLQTNGFDDYSMHVAEIKHSKYVAVGACISLSQKKYKSVCPDDVRNDLIRFISKSYKRSHFVRFTITDTSYLKTIIKK